MSSMEQQQDASQQREVLEFDLGVRVYPPGSAGGY